MVSKKELLKAIADCEAGADSFQSCQKLATLYTVLDHQYPSDTMQSHDTFPEAFVETDGSSEFLKAVNGKSASQVWAVVDELMSTLFVLNRKLYDAVLRRVKAM